jgi:hypothetical protein
MVVWLPIEAAINRCTTGMHILPAFCTTHGLQFCGQLKVNHKAACVLWFMRVQFGRIFWDNPLAVLLCFIPSKGQTCT